MMKYKNNLKRTSDVIKDSIGKAKCIRKFSPQKIITNNKIITDTDVIAKHFNTYFMEAGRNLSEIIETLAKTFEVYLRKQNIIQPENPLTINEIKDAFFVLKQIKVLVMMGLVLMLSETVSDR